MLKSRHSRLRKVNGQVRTIKQHLKNIGLYSGTVDNRDNQPFREACKRFLNQQRGYLTPKPPTAHRWARNFKG